MDIMALSILGLLSVLCSEQMQRIFLKYWFLLILIFLIDSSCCELIQFLSNISVILGQFLHFMFICNFQCYVVFLMFLLNFEHQENCLHWTLLKYIVWWIFSLLLFYLAFPHCCFSWIIQISQSERMPLSFSTLWRIVWCLVQWKVARYESLWVVVRHVRPCEWKSLRSLLQTLKIIE